MHGPINVKSPNNTRKWEMGFNSAFKGLRYLKTDLQEVGCVRKEWIILAQDRDRWRALVNVVINIWAP
jgi:hypothetical protein